MTRGEVWWLEHPAMGRRPACIVSRAEAVPVMRNVLVIPATRRVRGIPTEVSLGPEDGMPDACVLPADNVQPVPKELLVERVVRLRPQRLHEICRSLAIATGCD